MPDEAGIGQAPQSFANTASEWIRSGLSQDDEHLGRNIGSDAKGLSKEGSSLGRQRIEEAIILGGRWAAACTSPRRSSR